MLNPHGSALKTHHRASKARGESKARREQGTSSKRPSPHDLSHFSPSLSRFSTQVCVLTSGSPEAPVQDRLVLKTCPCRDEILRPRLSVGVQGGPPGPSQPTRYPQLGLANARLARKGTRARRLPLAVNRLRVNLVVVELCWQSVASHFTAAQKEIVKVEDCSDGGSFVADNLRGRFGVSCSQVSNQRLIVGFNPRGQKTASSPPCLQARIQACA